MSGFPVMVWGSEPWGASLWGPTSGPPPAQSVVLQFVDETGINPLPAGIEVTIYGQPYIAGFTDALTSGWTQPGGFSNITVPQGVQLIAFYGGSSQAPTQPSYFTTSTTSPQIVQAIPYVSPSLSQVGYATFQLGKYPKLWLGDAAKAPGGVNYALQMGYGQAMTNLDEQTQTNLAGLRLQSCMGDQLDTWENDMVGPMFSRYAGEVDTQFEARIALMVSRPRTTINAIQAIVQAFYNSTVSGIVNLGENIAFSVPGAGGYGAAGGYSVTAPVPGGSPPVPPILVWDGMTQPGLAASLGVTVNQFVIQVGIIDVSLEQQLAYGRAGGFSTAQGGFNIVNTSVTYPMLSNQAPDPRLGLLVNWLAKAGGTEPLYLVGTL